MLSKKTSNRERLSRDTAKDILVKLIGDGEIHFNTPLSERALAERIGVSRTPIREALQDLAREGIVTIHVRGAFVNAFTLDELRELYEVRIGLECIAAYRAALSGAHDGLKNLSLAFESLQRKPANPDTLLQSQSVGREFHMEMFKASKNKYLLSMYKGLELRNSAMRFVAPEGGAERILKAREEHMEILYAILDKNAAEAQILIRRHLQNSFDNRVLMYTRLPEFELSGPK